MSFKFGVSSWSLCLASDEGLSIKRSGVPNADGSELSQVPPMLRRRLNDYGRACATQFLAHCAVGEQVPVVYSSRHGDIQRTTNVLWALAEDEPVSPMQFSLAVHNALAGVLSIYTGNKENTSALSASAEGLVPVFFEGLGLLSQGYSEVLCVVSDSTLPKVYSEFSAEEDTLFAFAFVMTQQNQQFTLAYKDSAEKLESRDSPLLQVEQFVDAIELKSTEISLGLNGSSWQLSMKHE